MEPKLPSSDGNWRTKLIRTPLGWGLTLAIAAVGLYLLVTHTEHVLGALPYLLLIACPLLHVFGHGGHHHGPRDRN